MPKKIIMPKEIFVYQIDEVDGDPVYAVVTDLQDVNFEDLDSYEVEVGTYKQVRKGMVETRNEFKKK